MKAQHGLKGRRPDLDPQVSSLPLRTILLAATADPYCCTGHQSEHMGSGVNALALTLSERWGVTSRTAHRWMRDVRNLDTVSLYVADEIACAMDIPFASLYPEAV